MKYFLILSFLILLITVSGNEIYAQDTSAVHDTSIVQFIGIVNRISNFFETEPIFLDIQDHPKSPTGKIYILIRHHKVKLSYDALPSNSLGSSLNAYVRVQCTTHRCSGKYADFSFLGDRFYSKKELCLQDTIFNKGEGVMVFKIIYTYELNKWNLKGVTYEGDVGPYVYDDDWTLPENMIWLSAFRPLK
jgi:hypothetical protein